MDEKAENGYLVEYDGNERCRIYIEEKNKIFLSRDVKFDEGVSKCEQKNRFVFKDVPSEEEFEDEIGEENREKTFSDESKHEDT